MKNAERKKNLKRDVLVSIFEKPLSTASNIAEKVGVSRPTAIKIIDELVKEGIVCADKKNRPCIDGSYRLVLLKTTSFGAQLITVNCADKSVDRIELKSVLGMSESDNISRFIGIAQRHIDDLMRRKYNLLSGLITDVDVCKSKTFQILQRRNECIMDYLAYSAEDGSLLYLSLNSPIAHFYHKCEPISTAKRKGKLDAKALEGIFDVIIPERLVIDGAYLPDGNIVRDIEKLCTRLGVEFYANAREDLSIDELGAICALFEKHLE